jgi:serine/threonine protein kinase
LSLPEGTTIAERYRIDRLIGSGGMGIVYEVTHLTTGHRYALKTMRADALSNTFLVKALLDESKATARVKSEHIIKVTDAGIDGPSNLPFFVMELLEGVSLAAELERRRCLPPSEVVALVYQACLALDKTHLAGIVHRDLKPENLFLTTRDDGSRSLKILDFGIAKVVDQSTNARTTRNLGTPVYMSPEQYRGDGDIDHRADLYSLGHIVFTMLTGQSYWHAESCSGPYLLMTRVVTGAVEPATERARRLGVSLPARFDAWFDRATACESFGRFDTASDLVDALAAALATPIGATKPTRPLPRSGRFSARTAPPSQSRLIVGAVTVALVSAAVIATFVARGVGRRVGNQPRQASPSFVTTLGRDTGRSAELVARPAALDPEAREHPDRATGSSGLLVPKLTQRSGPADRKVPMRGTATPSVVPATKVSTISPGNSATDRW